MVHQIPCTLLPNKVILDRGNEFKAEFKSLIENDSSINIRPITSRNSQANSVLERVHQTMGTMIRTYEIQEMVLDDDDPWDGILSATMFALCSTVHAATQYSSTHMSLDKTQS